MVEHLNASAIKDKILELEGKHRISILFACESGSRAWGFPSPDSDYDARFIYVHPRDWYLSINEKRDVLELPISPELDISGWELRKTLRLLHKRNAVLFEWIQSPIVYMAKENFIKDFGDVSIRYFSPIAVMHHYLSSSKKYYETCISREVVKLKTLFYCLRTSLAALWIARTQEIPPMELYKLLKVAEHENGFIEKVKELVQLKAQKDESYLHPRDPILEAVIKKNLSECESAAPSLPKIISNDEMLNALFLRNLK
jgi:predicted nucleotidyltransferase